MRHYHTQTRYHFFQHSHLVPDEDGALQVCMHTLKERLPGTGHQGHDHGKDGGDAAEELLVVVCEEKGEGGRNSSKKGGQTVRTGKKQ